MTELSALRRAEIRGIRESMAALGIPLDHLTDEEIERGVEEAARVWRIAGVSTAEAFERMTALMETLKIGREDSA